MPSLPYTHQSASISGDNIYRYQLDRRWDGEPTGPHLLWVMINPSTAGVSNDDPTIRRVRGFTNQAGHSAFRVVNLFALRATNPKELLDHPDPVGPINDAVLTAAIADPHADMIIGAWGAITGSYARARARHVRKMVADAGRAIYHLGDLTSAGQPRHPLYLRGDAAFATF